MDEEGMSRMEAAKKGIGEIAFPIIISTATTVAAFVPLGFGQVSLGIYDVFPYYPIGGSWFVSLRGHFFELYVGFPLYGNRGKRTDQ